MTEEEYNQKYAGKKWNYLTAIKFDHKDSTGVYFLCKCDCGKEKVIRIDHVTSGSTISCGCKRKIGVKKHGLSRTRIYKEHQQLIQRCTNPNSPRYNEYGGRGITVCEEWLEPAPKGFENFYNWAINNGYRDDLSIDRINNDAGYSPDNCRWITLYDQSWNKQQTKHIDYVDGKHTVREIKESSGSDIDYDTLRDRLINYGNPGYEKWSMNDKLNIPLWTKRSTYRKDHNIINPVYFNTEEK